MDTQTPSGAGPAPDPGAGQRTTSTGFWTAVRGLGLRRSDDRWVAGVAGGLAERLGLDPLLVRGLFVVSLLLGGVGLVLYGVAWALLPDARDGRILLERLVAGDADGALLGALAAVVVGFARGEGWWWFWDGGGVFGGLMWAAFVALAVVVVVTSVRRQRGNAPAAPAAAWTAPGPTGTAPYAASAPYATTSQATGAQTPGAPTDPGATVPLPAQPQTGGAGAPPPSPPPYGAPPVPPPPAAAARPARPPRRGADGATVAVVVGLTVVALGVLLLAERLGWYAGPVVLAAGGIGLVLTGLGIVTLGLRGRTSGGLGALAVVGALVWVPMAAVHQDGGPGHLLDELRTGRVGSGVVELTTREAAGEGVRAGIGSSRVDLTDVPIEDGTLYVPIDAGIGEMTVVVPREAAVRAEVSSGIGTVVWRLDDDVHRRSGMWSQESVFEDEQAESGTPDIVLEIDAGIGEIRIIEEDA